MRHLVAGASGFLGSNLVDELLRRGDDVVGLDDLCTGRLENLSAARLNVHFSFVQADITQPIHVPGKFDRVWHLASPASPPDYLRLPVQTLRAGSVGTENLLAICRRDNARFLVTSTSEIYGDPLVSPQVESYWGNVNPIGPRSVYDEAKRFSEAMTMAYRRTFGVETRIARIFNTYGPRMRLDDGRVVPNFIGQSMRDEPLTIYGDGSQTRSFCYVSDQVDGLCRLMESEEADPVNIGNPRELTILEFAHALEKVLGRSLSIVHEALPTDDPRRRRPDITRARTLLGWEPRVDLEDGLRLTVEHFRSAARAG